MTLPLSNVIHYLGFDSTINIGGTHETIKVLLQQFGSLSVIITSDESLSFKIEFSNDGVNFDYDSYTTISGGITSTLTIAILAKWCKMSATNTSGGIATVRFNTYAHVIPITQQTKITKGGISPSINVDNFTTSLFNHLYVCQPKILNDHKFDYSLIVANVLQSPDRDFKQFSGGGITLASSTPNIISGVLSLNDIFKSGAGSYLGITGSPVIYRSGNPLVSTFSAKFDISGYTDGLTFGYDQQLIGIGFVRPSTGVVLDGIFIGYPSAPQAPDTIITEIALIYYNNGVETYIKRSNWNCDRLFGNGSSEVILDISKLGVWRLRTAYHGSASIHLEYHNPFDNSWISCHRMQYENLYTIANFRHPSLSFLMFTKRTSTASGSGSFVVGVGSASGQIGVELGQSLLGHISNYGIQSPLVTLVANTETNILSIKAGDLINSFDNRSINILLHLSFSSDGNKPAVFKFYKETTFTAGVWTYHNPNYSSVQILSAGSLVLPSGYLISGHYNDKIGVSDEDLKQFDVKLIEGETFTITAESTGISDINIFLTYGIID
jgi:hypothetical protein